MTTPGKENFRLKSYKNKSLNPDEMRRRREEEGLQLRKQKREEQVSPLPILIFLKELNVLFQSWLHLPVS